MPAGQFSRDPVSVTFDTSARRLLERAYSNRGEWVAVWLPDPTIRQRSRWIGEGINVDAPDPLPAGGGVNAHTRWARAFVRSVYYQHRQWSPRKIGGPWARRTTPRDAGGLRIQVGRHIVASPQFDPAHPERGGLPPRRRVRLQLAAGGRAKQAAVARLGNRDRIYTESGGQAARFAEVSYRDWV